MPSSLSFCRTLTCFLLDSVILITASDAEGMKCRRRKSKKWSWLKMGAQKTHTHTITLEVFPFKEKAVAFWQSQEFWLAPSAVCQKNPDQSSFVQSWFGSQPSSQGSGFNLKCNVSERVGPGRRAPYCSVFHCSSGSVPLLFWEHPPQPPLSVLEPFWISEVMSVWGGRMLTTCRDCC